MEPWEIFHKGGVTVLTDVSPLGKQKLACFTTLRYMPYGSFPAGVIDVVIERITVGTFLSSPRCDDVDMPDRAIAAKRSFVDSYVLIDISNQV